MRLTKRLPDGQAVMNCESCGMRGRGCTAWYCRNRLKDELVKYEDDVVLMVRCRDCIFHAPENETDWCTHPKGIENPADDDFCSYGKLKEKK